MRTLETGRLVSIQAPVKINIGCGTDPQSRYTEGFINCDVTPGEDVDYVFDACDKWPFPDNYADVVSSDHTLEHMDNPLGFFREAWRVLKMNGKMYLTLPYGWHSAAWWDLTHLRPWMQENFAILQPGYQHFTRNFQHESMGFAFWVVNCALVFCQPWSRLWWFRPLRPVIRFCSRHLVNVFQGMIMEAVKTTENDPRSVAFGGTNHPAVVPCSFAVYEHEYRGWSPDGLPCYRVLFFCHNSANSAAGF